MGFNQTSDDEKMEQILSDQRKAIQKRKQKQRQDIQALIKSQIDKEISEKINIEKERRQREKEEENNQELERMKLEKERKLNSQIKNLQEKISSQKANSSFGRLATGSKEFPLYLTSYLSLIIIYLEVSKEVLFPDGRIRYPPFIANFLVTSLPSSSSSSISLATSSE